MNKYQEVTPENTPANAIPYRKVNQPFRFQFVIPGKGVKIEEDRNGICYISADGISIDDLEAGDNISIDRTEDGKVVISSVNTATDIAAGQNITIDIDPTTGTAIISSVIGGPTNEHYKGVFDTPEDLIESVPEPEVGDYGMIKNIVISNGEATWNGQYKYCFYINGQWTVVDQMLTFTKNMDLLQQFYSVGGSSPVIYLHEVARSGDFWDLNNIPIVATPVVTVEGTTVTATCETEGAEIWYSTDGSMPHVNGTKYTGPITATQATTYRFVGIKNGMINSLEAVASADYELQAPIIELDWHDGTITMTNPNVDGNGDPVGTIYYTLNGNSPTNASSAYNGTFLPNFAWNKKTVKAIVYDGDNTVYSPESALDCPMLDVRLTASQVGGTGSITEYAVAVSGGVEVPDGEVHYTTDGSEPTFNSPTMTSALHFTRYGGNFTLKVKAFSPGFRPSVTSTGYSGYEKPTAPVISFDADTGSVTISASGNVLASPEIPFQPLYPNSDPSFGYNIYYTLDGSTPTAATGTLYTEPFQTFSTTVRAVVVAYGQYYSDVASQVVTIVNPPSFVINYQTGDVIISGIGGASFYYTTDGSTPTTESTPYTEPFNIVTDSDGEVVHTLKAIAVYNGQQSAVAQTTCTQRAKPTATASLNINSGTGNIILSNENGLKMYYTTDGSTPDVTSDSGKNPLQVPYQRFDPMTVKAFCAGGMGYVRSAVRTASEYAGTPDAPEITYDEETGLVEIALTGNTARVQLQTNNNAPTFGARIYYTTDGSTPTSATGTLYTGTFTLPEGVNTIKAMTECYGEYDSDVTTENIGQTADYLYFEAAEANSTVSLISDLYTAPNLEYSNDGETWQEWKSVYHSYQHIFDVITLANIGDKVYLRGNNPNGFSDLSDYLYSHFELTGKLIAGGNAQTIVDGNSPTLVAKTMPCFTDPASIQESDVLLSAPELPATTLSRKCYYYMFNRCTGLTKAPELPATTLASECYNGMFLGCAGLTQGPELPATTMESQCYSNLFSGCTGLTQAPELPATTLAWSCYSYMFSGCTGLTQAPELPATTLASECYSGMFSGCTGLTQSPELPATVLTGYCYCQMFYGCTSLVEIRTNMENVSAGGCLSGWLLNASLTGDFYCPSSLNISEGVNGIPSGWTRHDI